MPESKVDEKVMIVPGTDGNKMSKSYNNCIDIFVDDKQLRKQIMKIQTDSISISEPKIRKHVMCLSYLTYYQIVNSQMI